MQGMPSREGERTMHVHLQHSTCPNGGSEHSTMPVLPIAAIADFASTFSNRLFRAIKEPTPLTSGL